MSLNKGISIVIPVYRNAETLNELNSRIIANLKEASLGEEEFELIYIVDGSPDNSLEVLTKLQRGYRDKNCTIRIIELTKNYGQTAAIIAGIESSNGSATVVISADLQDPPEKIKDLILQWKLGYQIVISTRASREDSFVNILTSRIAHSVFRMTQPDMPKHGFDFFLVARDAGNNLIKIRGRNRFLQGDILSLGYDVKIISHVRVSRKFGNSGYTFISRYKLFIDSLFENRKFPITYIFSLGTLVSTSGILVGLLSIASYLMGNSPFSGFAAIFSSILFLGGIQIFLLGVIGQFVFRIFEISRDRPLYLIKKIWEF